MREVIEVSRLFKEGPHTEGGQNWPPQRAEIGLHWASNPVCRHKISETKYCNTTTIISPLIITTPSIPIHFHQFLHKIVLTRHASRLSQRNQENASNPHHSTPKKARVRAAYKELKQHDFTRARDLNTTLFQRLDIARSSSYRIITSENLNQSDWTFHNQPGVTETRGRRKLITD